MSGGYVTDEAEILNRIEKRLAAIEEKLAKFELAAAGFMSGPMISKLFGAIRAKD